MRELSLEEYRGMMTRAGCTTGEILNFDEVVFDLLKESKHELKREEIISRLYAELIITDELRVSREAVSALCDGAFKHLVAANKIRTGAQYGYYVAV